MITIKRQRWTYIIRTEPRDTASLLRLGAELEASTRYMGLVVVSYSPTAGLEVEDLHDRTRAVAEFVEIVRAVAGPVPVTVVAGPVPGRGRAA